MEETSNQNKNKARIITLGEVGCGKSFFINHLYNFNSVNSYNLFEERCSSYFFDNNKILPIKKNIKKNAKLNNILFEIFEIAGFNPCFEYNKNDIEDITNDLNSIITNLSFNFIFIVINIRNEFINIFKMIFDNFEIFNENILYIILNKGDKCSSDDERDKLYSQIIDYLKNNLIKKNKININLNNVFKFDKNNINDSLREIHKKIEIEELKEKNGKIFIKKNSNLEKLFLGKENVSRSSSSSSFEEKKEEESRSFLDKIINFINENDFFKSPDTII